MKREQDYIITRSCLLDYYNFSKLINLNFAINDEYDKRNKIIDFLNEENLLFIENELVVYGSYAYRNLKFNSDLDLITISNQLTRPAKLYFRFYDNFFDNIIPAEIVIIPTGIDPLKQWYGLSGQTRGETFPFIGTIGITIPNICGREGELFDIARYDVSRILNYLNVELKSSNEFAINSILQLINTIFNPAIPKFRDTIGELKSRLDNGLREIWLNNITEVKKVMLKGSYKYITEDRLTKKWTSAFIVDRLVDKGHIEFNKYFKDDN